MFLWCEEGHVSFPGGHLDQGETDIQAALRETEEELGRCMHSDMIEVLGRGPPILAITGTIVYPIFGWIKEDVQRLAFDKNEEEVEEIFTVPIKRLIDPNLKEYEAHVRQQLSKEQTNEKHEKRIIDTPGNKHKPSIMLPVFYGGKHKIWGLTSIITDHFLKFVIIPALRDQV